MKKRYIISTVFFLIVFCPHLAAPGMSRATEDSQETELFLVAQKAFDDGFYDVAIRYIEQFLQKYPQTQKHVQAKLLLGQCYFFKNHYLKAFDTFQGLLTFSELQDATLFWLGETYFKGSDYTQAEKHYRKLIDLYPDSVYIPQAYYSLAWTFSERNDYEKTKEILLYMIEHFPAHQLTEDATFKLGESEHTLKNYESARKFFLQYITKYPKSTRHAEAYFYTAEGFYFSENFLEAITYYAKAAAIAYDQKVALMSKISMGWCYLKLGKHDLAERYFNEAQQIADEQNMASDEILLGKSSIYSETEKYPEAQQTYNDLISRFPESPRIAEAYLGKANIDYILKNYDDAITGYQWLRDHYAEDKSRQEIFQKASYGLAWTYLKAGNIDESIKIFEDIMTTSESKTVKISALTQIGDAYHEINELQKSIAVYDRILKDYPDSIFTDYVQFRQGIALLKSERLEAAMLSFQSLQVNFPKSKYLHEAQYYLGVAHFKAEDWTQSAQYMEAYLKDLQKIDPLASEAHYVLGLSYFHAGQFNTALKTFQDIVVKYPDKKIIIPIAHFYIAKSQYQLGQIKEAVKKFNLITQNYQLTEIALDSLLWLGAHHLENGEWDAAIGFYQQILDQFPGSEKIDAVYFEMGQVYQAKGDIETALGYYRRISPNSTNQEIFAKAQLTIAEILAEEQDPEITIESFLDIAQKAPDFRRDAYVKIADIQEKQQHYPEAIQSYLEALKSRKGLSKTSEAEIQFHIGDLQELLNEPEKAVEEYLKIPYLYQSDVVWIIKAYLRIARIFEDTEQWEQAHKTYKKILEHETEEKKYARERIEWIEQNILNLFSHNP